MATENTEKNPQLEGFVNEFSDQMKIVEVMYGPKAVKDVVLNIIEACEPYMRAVSPNGEAMRFLDAHREEEKADAWKKG